MDDYGRYQDDVNSGYDQENSGYNGGANTGNGMSQNYGNQYYGGGYGKDDPFSPTGEDQGYKGNNIDYGRDGYSGRYGDNRGGGYVQSDKGGYIGGGGYGGTGSIGGDYSGIGYGGQAKNASSGHASGQTGNYGDNGRRQHHNKGGLLQDVKGIVHEVEGVEDSRAGNPNQQQAGGQTSGWF